MGIRDYALKEITVDPAAKTFSAVAEEVSIDTDGSYDWNHVRTDTGTYTVDGDSITFNLEKCTFLRCSCSSECDCEIKDILVDENYKTVKCALTGNKAEGHKAEGYPHIEHPYGSRPGEYWGDNETFIIKSLSKRRAK
eukprot:TRINITY_DN12615_c0_g1_i1.p1 TRINITY_DN12615_c0_g1~~TRINITY_DN12615_c0_g1_i1.p1  ORF type:complete len:138 (-),score=32.52 TRINITY_DN12615_c0_g1_i1:3-416(-)